MTTAAERMTGYDRMKRSCRTASAWFVRASAIAREVELPRADPDWSLEGHEVGQMLRRILADADVLVPILNEDDIDEIQSAVKDLAAALRRRVLLEKMKNTSGRTDAEKEVIARARERLSA